MGVKVKGAGTHSIEIEGKSKLKGGKISLCPDWTEAGTFFIAFAITGGRGTIKNINLEHLTFFLEKMKEAGINFSVKKNELLVKKSKKLNLYR